MRTLIKLLLVVVVVGLLGWGAMYLWGGKTAAAVQFRTVKVERGDVVSSIGATGTLEPDEVVDVGSQVTGKIMSFGVGTDGKKIDYNSEVKEGSVVGTIDPTTYRASVREAEAQRLQGVAGVERAEADKLTAQAKLNQAKSDWERAEKIGPGDALAQTQYDTYKSNYEQAQAAIAVADAAIATAKATVEQADSAKQRAQINLDYCTITSPVDGVVIDRRVNVGQTVVSSQAVSSMFLIARDLRHMQIWVSVNEADIGKIHIGQPVSFTCDTFGDRQFKGSVKNVRRNAQMTQNVVIYVVEVSTDNADLTLMPYQTANVAFELERADSTLKVSSAALRWQPTPEQIVPDERDKYAAKDNGKPASGPSGGDQSAADKPAGDKGPGDGGKGGKGHGGKKKDSNASASFPGTVWVKEGEFVRPVAVMAGVSDGADTAVTADALKENDDVVTGTITVNPGDAANGPTNPFLPQMRRGGGGGRR